MRIGDKSNRPRVAHYVPGIRVEANHYRYGAKYSIRWKSGIDIDPESSEVYSYQKVWPYIPKGTVEHDYCNVIPLSQNRNAGVSRLEVSDRAEGVNGIYSSSDRISCSMRSQ
jgi:hypothetical protein